VGDFGACVSAAVSDGATDPETMESLLESFEARLLGHLPDCLDDDFLVCHARILWL